MNSALEQLADTGVVRREPMNGLEYHGLLASGRSRLSDAARTELSKESRFDLAYNASHALCLAALRRRGYRSSQRYVVFQVLSHTLGLGPEVWRVLDKAHRLRNAGEYEGFLDVDERLLEEVIAAANRVLEELER
jgi:hypothetical protein